MLYMICSFIQKEPKMYPYKSNLPFKLKMICVNPVINLPKHM